MSGPSDKSDPALKRAASGGDADGGVLPVLHPAERRDTGPGSDALTARAREIEQREMELSALEMECRDRVREAESAVADLRRQLVEQSRILDEIRRDQQRAPIPDNLLAFAPRRAAEMPVDELVTSLTRAADATQVPVDALSLEDRIVELESDLSAAEDQIHALEAELRKARGQQVATVSSEPSHAHTEIDPTATDHIDEGVFAEGPARFLALIDGDTEILHRLSRRVSIGRAPDNDIRVDARFVSRYHAAVMAGPGQTVIEDLGSTNGILVNGRRVTRHLLRDGDVVRIGKSRFRFLTRPR
jgi:hypothetical protein